MTIPVQALVQDGRVYIPGGKGKHNIIGFYVSFLSFHFKEIVSKAQKRVGRRRGKGRRRRRKKNHDAMLDADLWVFT